MDRHRHSTTTPACGHSHIATKKPALLIDSSIPSHLTRASAAWPLAKVLFAQRTALPSAAWRSTTDAATPHQQLQWSARAARSSGTILRRTKLCWRQHQTLMTMRRLRRSALLRARCAELARISTAVRQDFKLPLWSCCGHPIKAMVDHVHRSAMQLHDHPAKASTTL